MPYRSGTLRGNFYFIPGSKPAPYNPPEPTQDDPTALLRKANTFFTNKQYQDAISIYNKLANDGNAGAQNRMGNFYENGYGVTKDNIQALAWYKKAADQGDMNAQTALDRLQNNPAPSTPNKENEQKRNPAEPEMVFVQGGAFWMGCSGEQGKDCLKNENPLHSVTVSNFYIGKYEVTQKQWQQIMGNNPSHFKGDNLPVENVSWNDTQEFIRRLNEATGKQYRLATEAEWEYAARGGNKSQGYKYSGSNILNDVAWYRDNSGGATHPVGSKRPNELGIYDMSGNVWEWCQDRYGQYRSSPKRDPKGPSLGALRVLRGGGWNYDARDMRVSYRNSTNTPDHYYYNLGFRIVCNSH